MKKLSDDQAAKAYIVRMANEEIERHLFMLRWLYVGIRRDWSAGSKILFARKTHEFIGSGIVAEVVVMEQLGEIEKELCRRNNWYAKIIFGKLTRFHPPVPVQDTPIAGKNLLLLHGLEITLDEASTIETISQSKIIT